MIVHSLRKVGGFSELEDDEPHPALMMALIEAKRGGVDIAEPLSQDEEQRVRATFREIYDSRESDDDQLYSRALNACQACIMQEARASKSARGNPHAPTIVHISGSHSPQLCDLELMFDRRSRIDRTIVDYDNQMQESAHQQISPIAGSGHNREDDDFAPRPTMLAIARELTDCEKKTRLRKVGEREDFARIIDLARSRSEVARELHDAHQT